MIPFTFFMKSSSMVGYSDIADDTGMVPAGLTKPMSSETEKERKKN
jgi:hypothetical protein